MSSIIGAVGTEATDNGGFSVLTITRNTVSGGVTTLPGGREGTTVTRVGCPSVSCRVTRSVRRTANRRAEIAMPNRFRENNDPSTCSHIVSAHFNIGTTRLVVGGSCNGVITLMGGGMITIPLRSVTNGLGDIPGSDRIIRATEGVNVDFNR